MKLNSATIGPGPVQISVVMPSLNQVRFIERAIRSVLSQRGVTLELIVMDGGSTDGTQDLLSRLAREADGRLRWISERDRGPAHAVNKAIAMARASIIGWLNADDIYMPGAAARALQALEANPAWVMVYGHARHIDENDRVIGDYPTRLPGTPIETFANGCFVCQPTVFLRQSTLGGLGPLDEGLKSAFDFDWWLRSLNRYPGRMGFVDAVQAHSRLHEACITRCERETVMHEGMHVLARHLGAAPLHWFKTYANEVLADYPHGRPIDDLKAHILSVGEGVAGFLSLADRQELHAWLGWDARINLTIPDACLEVYSDGWLPRSSTLRVRARDRVWRQVELVGRHISKSEGPLRLAVRTSDGRTLTFRVSKRGPFNLAIPLAAPARLPAYWSFTIETEGGFIPNDHDPNANDARELACRIDAIRLHASDNPFQFINRSLQKMLPNLKRGSTRRLPVKSSSLSGDGEFLPSLEHGRGVGGEGVRMNRPTKQIH